MNKKLLMQVAEYIVRVPESFNQGTYLSITLLSPGICHEGVAIPVCKTEQCIAGTGVLLHDPLNFFRIMGQLMRQGKDFRGSSILEAAIDAFKLTRQQATRLFSGACDWPEPYRTQYLEGSKAEQAKVAARRIKRFIQTEGRV